MSFTEPQRKHLEFKVQEFIITLDMVQLRMFFWLIDQLRQYRRDGDVPELWNSVFEGHITRNGIRL